MPTQVAPARSPVARAIRGAKRGLAKGEQTRADIVDVALAMAARVGLEGLSIGTLAEAVGKEVRVNIYAGRPVRAADLASPALIERNQVVTLNYSHGGLTIATDARALDRAGPGERIRVMNLESRSMVTGVVMVDGTVNVAPTSN